MIDFKLDTAQQTLYLTFPGNILSTNAADLKDEVMRLLESDVIKAAQWSCLRVDLTHARMIDSFGFDFLMNLFKMMEENSVKIKVTVASSLIRRNFALLRLDKMVEIELVARAAKEQDHFRKEKP